MLICSCATAGSSVEVSYSAWSLFVLLTEHAMSQLDIKLIAVNSDGLIQWQSVITLMVVHSKYIIRTISLEPCSSAPNTVKLTVGFIWCCAGPDVLGCGRRTHFHTPDPRGLIQTQPFFLCWSFLNKQRYLFSYKKQLLLLQPAHKGSRLLRGSPVISFRPVFCHSSMLFCWMSAVFKLISRITPFVCRLNGANLFILVFFWK